MEKIYLVSFGCGSRDEVHVTSKGAVISALSHIERAIEIHKLKKPKTKKLPRVTEHLDVLTLILEHKGRLRLGEYMENGFELDSELLDYVYIKVMTLKE